MISENAKSILRNEVGSFFELRKEPIGPPTLYLGGRLSKVQLENGVHAWAFSASQYVQTSVKYVEDFITGDETKRWRMPKNADIPLMPSYDPDLNVSPELNPTEASYYVLLIGVLWWIVELQRVDICLEVSMMSSHLALPRECHLEEVLHIFAHLKKYHSVELIYEPKDHVIDVSL